MDQGNAQLKHFQELFGTEEACADYLFHAKWPDGFSCPRCGSHHAYKTATRRLPLFECAHCRHQTSLTAGTIFENSRTALTKWFLALYLVSQLETGISAVALSEAIH
ncbi:transposase [Paenibacillus cremeus]|uniref:Transposase n=1 Tax=Paenibacillus cremeus TaxID=2163881 RepID=A0A559KIJ4_9BACL|nr:transposase [Paenibacillus cremeus]TVY11929.1 transposase [Paenibacillus cremeus]